MNVIFRSRGRTLLAFNDTLALPRSMPRPAPHAVPARQDAVGRGDLTWLEQIYVTHQVLHAFQPIARHVVVEHLALLLAIFHGADDDDNEDCGHDPKICEDILDIFEKHPIPSAASGESKVFYHKIATRCEQERVFRAIMVPDVLQ